jgi:hypothetical protein
MAARASQPAESEDATQDLSEERDDDGRDDEDPELRDAMIASDRAQEVPAAWTSRPRAARPTRWSAEGARGGHARTIERPPHA